MRLERFVKECDSLGGQRRALAALEAPEGPALRETITPAAALAFGAVPLGEHGGRLVFAAVPEAHPDCERALAAALGRPVALSRFDPHLVREAISRFYVEPRGEKAGVDLQTFETPEFLSDARSAKRLLSEKSSSLPEEDIPLPGGLVAFVDLRVHSVLRSLDVRRRVEFAPTKSMLAFRLEQDDGGPRAVLFRDRLPPEDVRAVVSQGFFYDGDEHVQAVVSRDVTKLPHVIHPSELQLAGLDGDEARFWVYDRIESVRACAAEPAASWSVKYYFLHFGTRMERALRLEVLAFAVVPRSKIRLAGKADRLAPVELERVFGLDFAYQ